jgi:hypothetical protein
MFSFFFLFSFFFPHASYHLLELKRKA